VSDPKSPSSPQQPVIQEPPQTEVVEIEPIIGGGEYSTRSKDPERLTSPE
jgi:hypothetical protein